VNSSRVVLAALVVLAAALGVSPDDRTPPHSALAAAAEDRWIGSATQVYSYSVVQPDTGNGSYRQTVRMELQRTNSADGGSTYAISYFYEQVRLTACTDGDIEVHREVGSASGSTTPFRLEHYPGGPSVPPHWQVLDTAIRFAPSVTHAECNSAEETYPGATSDGLAFAVPGAPTDTQLNGSRTDTVSAAPSTREYTWNLSRIVTGPTATP